MSINRTPIFLAAYRETGSVGKACKLAKVARQTHYNRLKKDAKYAAAFLELQDEIVESMEIEAIRRARDGIVEPVVYQGKFTFMKVRDERGRIQRSSEPLGIRKYSDSLLMFLLRAAKPERYRERMQVSGSLELSGTLTIADVLRQRRAKRTKPEPEPE